MKATRVSLCSDGTAHGHSLTLEDGTPVEWVQACEATVAAGEIATVRVTFVLPRFVITGELDRAALRAHYDVWQQQVAAIAAEFDRLLAATSE